MESLPFRTIAEARFRLAQPRALSLILILAAYGLPGNAQRQQEAPNSAQRAYTKAQNSGVQAITHATVIDPGTGGDEQRNITILIRGSEIVFVGKATDAQIPRGAVIHDVTGHYVIPGLWDAHVHLTQTGARAFPLFVENGITSVRDMG